MNALVTGGGGFLGLYIVEQLVARGDQVRVFCRGHYSRLEQLGVECVTGDIRDADAVSQVCAGVDTVFHVAAIPGIWGPWKKFYETNTLGTQHIIDGCTQHGVSRLIYTSSPSVVYDGREHENADESLPYATTFLCHYPHSKALAEQAVLAANGESGLATTALRPHLIWGPRDNHLIPRLVARAKSGRLRKVGAGDNLISMSYVENAAAAHLQAADKLTLESPVAGQAYFINEPKPVRMWDWINEILALGDLPPVRKSISVGAARTIGAICEGIYATLRISAEPPMTRFLAAQLSSSHYYRIEKAKRDFGYTPLVSFEDAMQRLKPDVQRFAEKV